MLKRFILAFTILLSFGLTANLFADYTVDFEGTGETKTSYASGTVNLSGLDWDMTEALIGTDTADFKNGARSARMRGYGTSSMTMLADKANGIGSISFLYRRYGTDTQVDWKVEYSTDSGSSWIQIGSAFTAPASDDVQTFSESIQYNGSVRVRIKRATETGTSNRRLNIDDIVITDYSGGSPDPTISVSGTLTEFSAYTGTPSASQSYTLTGANLTAGIEVTPPAGFAISTDDVTFYTTAQTLAADYNGLVYVRLTGTTAGTYSGNITHTSTGATQVDKAVSGTVTDPTPLIHATGTLSDFTTLVGTPSAPQTYTLYGEFLTNNIDVSCPGGFELSTDGTNYSGLLSLSASFNGSIYVRLTGTDIGSFSGNIAHVSSPAPQVDLPVSGSVTEPLEPTLFLEENFPYTAATLLTDNGWIAHSGAGTQPAIVGSSGLVYTNYPPATGLSGQTVFSGSAEDVHRTFATQTSGNIYTAFLYNALSLPNTTGDYQIHFGPGTIGTDFKGRFFIQKDSSENLRFGLTKAAASAVWTDYVYAQNTTYLIVIKYVINSGAANDQVYMWVNPTISTTEPAPMLTASDVTGADAANIGSIAIRQGTNTPLALIDGIRVTNDWATLWSGEAPPTPVIIATGTPDPMTNIAGTPSEDDSYYSLSGENLTGPVTIVAPTGFEVSSTGIDGWDDTIQVPADFDGTIHVRLVSSEVGTHAGFITHNSPGATEVTVAVEGETLAPAVVWNIVANFTSFDHTVGTPSASQSYTLSATNASQDINVTATNGFELSQDNSNWSTQLTLANNFNGTLYVRLNSSTAGTINGTITHATVNATPNEINVSGVASPPAGNYTEDLILSEYIEGGSYNKAIEIYNGTGASVNLSSYTLKKSTNGAVAWSVTLALGDVALAHNDVYVIAHADASQGIQDVSELINSDICNFNGDDAIGLFKNDVLIDVIGLTDGIDPGYGWPVAGVATATQNHTLIRKPTIVEGNTNWALSAGTDADDSEWIVMAQDYITDLGSHTFSGDLPIAETPTFNPEDGGVYYSPINVSMSSSTPNATIYYTVDGSIPSDTNGFDYSVTGPVAVSATTTIKAIAYANGYAASSVAEALYVFPVDVTDIATLRAGTPGVYYRLTSVGVISFQQTYRNQKFIQDATAGILVDDLSGKIQTAYNQYDGIVNLVGTLLDFNGMLQFTPYTDPGAPYSTGNTITPQVITLNELV